jgi:perosamine synthetase
MLDLPVVASRSGSARPAATRHLIPVSEPNLSDREKRYVLECLESGWISSNGSFIGRFEEAFARWLGSRAAIAVGNGTSALHAALLGLGIGRGDEVIVPTFTFIATANAVHYTGAAPVFVDMEPDTWNLDPSKVEAAITARTKAIVVVHLYGHPCDMDAVLAIARTRSLYVVEDAAEAVGSRYRDRHVGTMGHVGAFSFYGNKTLTTGEGGMVVTGDPTLEQTIRLVKGQGVSPHRRYFFERVGYNYRMTNIQAAIGLAQVERAGELIALKRRNARLYLDGLKGVEGLGLPVERPYAFNTYWMFSVTVERAFGLDRDALMARLAEDGIETRPFFYPCHSLPPYRGSPGAFPVAEAVAAKGINLPSSTKLGPDDISRVVDALRSARR